MSKSIEKIRKKIDALDNQIHEALQKRVELVEEIAAVKRKSKVDFVQPAREAQLIRRVLERHQSKLPPAAIVRVWRELVGAMCLLQTGLKVAVSMEEENLKLWDYARAYFGSVITMQKFSNPLVAIAAVREGDMSFAVLPWPQDEDQNPWWMYLMNNEVNIKIVAALPYGSVEGEVNDVAHKGLIISKVAFDPSGDDHSFIALDIQPGVSRARIVDVLKSLGFEPLSITSKPPTEEQGHSLHLVEVNDYLAVDDPRLAEIEAKFEDHMVTCSALGGYPVPPLYQRGVPHNV